MKKLLFTAILGLAVVAINGCTTGNDAAAQKCQAGKCQVGKCAGAPKKAALKCAPGKCAAGKCAGAPKA